MTTSQPRCNAHTHSAISATGHPRQLNPAVRGARQPAKPHHLCLD
jgi:hypothetical protein